MSYLGAQKCQTCVAEGSYRRCHEEFQKTLVWHKGNFEDFILILIEHEDFLDLLRRSIDLQEGKY